ncbi:MAG: hypothetical protein FJ125_10945, partial [Deltaproteobacteria bacterium]|nr:hypothetical protein [Deltaproteobacteria bacterium]
MMKLGPHQRHARLQWPQQRKSHRDGGGRQTAVAPVALASLLLPLFTSATSPAWASDARRHGLAGNLGFEDDTDVHAFPQLVARHGNRFGLELAEGGQLLRGGATFGEAAALGLFIHRPVTGDWFEPFDDGQALLLAFSHFSSLAPPPGTTLESPTPLLELALGFRSGLGFGLKLANSMDQAVIQVQEVQEPPEGEEGGEPKTLTKDVEEGAQSTSLVLNAGWSAYRSNLSFDLGGSLAFHKFKTVVQGKIRGESSLSPSFHLLGRGVLRRTTSTSWLLIAQIYRRNYAVELPFFDNVADQRLLGVRGAFGQRVVLADTVTIATLAWLGYDTLGYALAKAVEDGSALDGKPGKLTRESTLRTYTLPGLDV